MAKREEIQRLIRDLSSDHVDVREAAVLAAALVLEQRYLRECVQRALGDEEIRKDLPPDYALRRRGEIRQDFRALSEHGLLPRGLVDVALAAEDADRITSALAALLHGPPGIAGAAASALGYTARPEVIRVLAQVVRQEAPADSLLAHQAIGAVGRILGSMDPRRERSTKQSAVIGDALDALRFAAGIAGEGSSAHQLAEEELSRLTQYFGSAR